MISFMLLNSNGLVNQIQYPMVVMNSEGPPYKVDNDLIFKAIVMLICVYPF